MIKRSLATGSFLNLKISFCVHEKALDFHSFDRSIFVLPSRVSDSGGIILNETSSLAKELIVFQDFRLTFHLFPLKFAACSPSRDNHCKAPYSRTRQRDPGAG